MYFKEAGIFKYQKGLKTLFISLRKGGVIYLIDENGVLFTDFGCRIVNKDKSVAVSHWQDPSYIISCIENLSDTTLKVSGIMSMQKHLRPGPFKHIMLRLLSRFFGNSIIPFLKKQLIFRNRKSAFSFERQIKITDNKVIVTDNIKGLNNQKVDKALHYSMRHVSSAGRFCSEELLNKNKQFSAHDFPIKTEISLN